MAVKDMSKIVIGQEAICPDGLGRIVAYEDKFPKQWIKISTYINDRGCEWSPDNVTLVEINTYKSYNLSNTQIKHKIHGTLYGGFPDLNRHTKDRS